MATVPQAREPEGGTRIWATFADRARAARAARALVEAGLDERDVALAEDPGATEGPVAHEREHREGTRIVGPLGLGALLGACAGALIGVVLALALAAGTTGLALFTLAGALFLGGVGAFVSGIGSLRAATLDHRRVSGDAPGGAAVEARARGEAGERAVEVLRRERPMSLMVTDAFGRPLRRADGEPPALP